MEGVEAGVSQMEGAEEAEAVAEAVEVEASEVETHQIVGAEDTRRNVDAQRSGALQTHAVLGDT